MEDKYTLERSLLRQGDIILTAENSATSKGIRVNTLSRYSHAAIWVGGTMIEAVPRGVFSKSGQRLMLAKASQCTVLRSRRPLTDQQLEKICAYARSQVGSLYALNEAILMLPRRWMKLETTKKQFCSRLVALAYAEIDYDFINLRSPSYCTPGQLSRVKAFERVQGVVRRASAEEIEFEKTFDPTQKNAEDTFEWLAKVRKMVGSDPALKAEFDIQTIGDVATFLLQRPEYDAKVVSFLHENDYLTYYDHDVGINKHRYNPIWMTQVLRAMPDKQSFIDQEIGKEISLIEHHPQNIFNGVSNYLETGLRFTYEHLKLYTNILTGAYVRLQHIAIACEAVGMHSDAQRAEEMKASIAHPLMIAGRVIRDAQAGSAT
ncbi:YiiX/YebB-like N1pC/P60 family cysteine hydrolase [Pseudomonas putida]|uniref:YiiX/YebB-like N1pC/P60 family cysteine hydrolase n=1 Tax=Pseudomonas putida TaxID=303 RepID=UPI001F51D374|nr:YiiX/YebB-like N1pC/P60 family cysteine hydrolase [Pseudomonas putida]MCI0911814.1 hypothetical protein [Pseudomonas putida]